MVPFLESIHTKMKTILLIFLFPFCNLAVAEMHQWTIQGKSVRAKYVMTINKKIILKTKEGKQIRVSFSSLSKEDQTYLELLQPPSLKINFTKTTKQRIFPPNIREDEPPKAQYMTFFVNITQTSTQKYRHKMVVEYFAFGQEINGKRKVFLGHETRSFFLKGYGDSFRFQGITYELPKYHLKVKHAKKPEDEEWLPYRGIRYGGFLVIIKDKTGKIIASKASSKKYLHYIENLRKLHAGCFFDFKTGERTPPTRPPHFPVLYQ